MTEEAGKAEVCSFSGQVVPPARSSELRVL